MHRLCVRPFISSGKEIPKGFTGSYPIELLEGKGAWRETTATFQRFPHMQGHVHGMISTAAYVFPAPRLRYLLLHS